MQFATEAKIRILVVDDDSVTRELLKEVLAREGYEIEVAPSGEHALNLLKTENFPVVLSDIRMVDMDGIRLLKENKKIRPGTVFILMTGFGSMSGAVEAVQEGAFDYVSKPFKMDELKAIVARAVKHWKGTQPLQSRGAKAIALSTKKIPLKANALIGTSPRIVEVYKSVARAAPSSSTVLLTGESGTGKELVAHAIHDNGPRQKNKFVAINCGALTETLLESELFGHVKGAFTGAANAKKGLIEEADHGTLFLDEIGDIPAVLQVKILRVLQDGEYKPVGSVESRVADIRVIAATHQDLEALVRAGKFREDLFFRLKVIWISLPPLRERMEDLQELVEYFVARFSEKNKKAVSHISEEAFSLLKKYSWPGNVRELEHAIERAVALTNTSVLYPEDFPPEVLRATEKSVEESPKGAVGPAVAGLTGAAQNPANSLEEMEKTHIIKVLKEVNYNKSKASERLGIDRATLYRKAQRYGIDLKK